jgi:hypothetical protein
MNPKIVMAKSKKPICIAVSVATMLLLGACAGGQSNTGSGSSASASASLQTLSNAQLESLVSPIALYPDSLLSIMLLASTYPLEVAEAYNWRSSNASLQGSVLTNALNAQS